VTSSRAPGFRHLRIRVAATTTAVVAILYVLVAGVVLVLVRQNLTAAIDRRLTFTVAALQSQGGVASLIADGGPLEPDADSGGRRFGAPLLVWFVAPNGKVAASDATAELPAVDRRVTVPVDATVSGTSLRIAGGRVAGGWVAVGQTTSEVTNALANVLLAEAVIAPVLLLAVFLGAWAVGRRVAAPIERAHARQLDFTADASHELRTPLTVIEAEAALAIRSARKGSAPRQALERIRDESLDMGRLVDDLLWLARFDGAPAPPEAVPIDVGALATTTAERFRAVCEQRGLNLDTRVTGTSSPVISAPAEWLARLVSVLVDNAVKYSPSGGEVRVEVSTGAGRVRFAIEDTGPGIPAEDRQRVFDRFHRATDHPGGAGLGLAIASAIVHGTGGRWEIGAAPGGGARMAVSWARSGGRTYTGRSVEQIAGLGADREGG
jgi:two-component system, OmpR family, sensor histidine kinase CiaH